MASSIAPNALTLAPPANDDDHGLVPFETRVEFPQVGQQADRQAYQTQTERTIDTRSSA